MDLVSVLYASIEVALFAAGAVLVTSPRRARELAQRNFADRPMPPENVVSLRALGVVLLLVALTGLVNTVRLY